MIVADTPKKARQLYATLAEPVQERQEIPEVYMYFSQMVDQVPSSEDLPVRRKCYKMGPNHDN